MRLVLACSLTANLKSSLRNRLNFLAYFRRTEAKVRELRVRRESRTRERMPVHIPLFKLFCHLNMNTATVNCQLHKAFVVPYSRYCSAFWYFCDSRNRPKLENISKRSLRPGCSGRELKSLHYLELLSKFNRSDLYSTKTLWIQFLRQSTHVVVFKWDILNATYGSR